jgi:hypothetical protein
MDLNYTEDVVWQRGEKGNFSRRECDSRKAGEFSVCWKVADNIAYY